MCQRIHRQGVRFVQGDCDWCTSVLLSDTGYRYCHSVAIVVVIDQLVNRLKSCCSMYLGVTTSGLVVTNTDCSCVMMLAAVAFEDRLTFFCLVNEEWKGARQMPAGSTHYSNQWDPNILGKVATGVRREAQRSKEGLYTRSRFCWHQCVLRVIEDMGGFSHS